jgi:hypothetical protein
MGELVDPLQWIDVDGMGELVDPLQWIDVDRRRRDSKQQNVTSRHESSHVSLTL